MKIKRYCKLFVEDAVPGSTDGLKKNKCSVNSLSSFSPLFLVPGRISPGRTFNVCYKDEDIVVGIDRRFLQPSVSLLNLLGTQVYLNFQIMISIFSLPCNLTEKVCSYLVSYELVNHIKLYYSSTVNFSKFSTSLVTDLKSSF